MYRYCMLELGRMSTPVGLIKNGKENHAMDAKDNEIAALVQSLTEDQEITFLYFLRSLRDTEEPHPSVIESSS